MQIIRQCQVAEKDGAKNLAKILRILWVSITEGDKGLGDGTLVIWSNLLNCRLCLVVGVSHGSCSGTT
jgi:hypothetical protein